MFIINHGCWLLFTVPSLLPPFMIINQCFLSSKVCLINHHRPLSTIDFPQFPLSSTIMNQSRPSLTIDPIMLIIFRDYQPMFVTIKHSEPIFILVINPWKPTIANPSNPWPRLNPWAFWPQAPLAPTSAARRSCQPWALHVLRPSRWCRSRLMGRWLRIIDGEPAVVVLSDWLVDGW